MIEELKNNFENGMRKQQSMKVFYFVWLNIFIFFAYL